MSDYELMYHNVCYRKHSESPVIGTIAGSPEYFMTDFCQEEIYAIESTFLGRSDSKCLQLYLNIHKSQIFINLNGSYSMLKHVKVLTTRVLHIYTCIVYIVYMVPLIAENVGYSTCTTYLFVFQSVVCRTCQLKSHFHVWGSSGPNLNRHYVKLKDQSVI